MSSLADQLKRLAVPHTQALFGRDTSRQSLLFDPKEAAQLDKETFFALGLNGLEELENIDPVFQKFEDTLFNESSLTFERSVQTKEVNDRLDETISELLTRLSPYFLLKPAHKVLEWLIHRYHVQFYNTDELMICILPYHETKIFVRVVQLLKLDGAPTKWDWLLPIQKSGVHLSHSVLINHCKSDQGFLGFICDAVKTYTKVHVTEGSDGGNLRVLFSFFTSTIVGVLEAGGATESTISTLLPHLSRGLKSSLSDHKAASYMILCQLVTKVTIKVNVLETLLNVLAKNMTPELLASALGCMVLIFQTQSIEELPRKCFRYLCRVPVLEGSLSQLTSQFQTQGFLKAFLSHLIPAAVKHSINTDAASSESETEQDWLTGLPRYCPLLEAVVRDVLFDERLATFTARAVIEHYLERCESVGEAELMDSVNKGLRGTIRLLESRYSLSMDKALDALLSEANTEVKRSRLQQFIDLTLTSIQHHVITDDSSNLTLALHHRLGEVRKQAVIHVVDKIDTMQEEDSEFVEDTILKCLTDEHRPVVIATLQLRERIWSLVSNKQKLLSTLVKAAEILHTKKVKRSTKKSVSQVLSVLCSCEEDLMPDVFQHVFSFLFMWDSDGVGVTMVTAILQSKMAEEHPLLKTLKKDLLPDLVKWEPHQPLTPLNMSLVTSLVNHVLGMDTNGLIKTVESLLTYSRLNSPRRAAAQALASLILDSLLQQSDNESLQKSAVAMAQLSLLKDLLSPVESCSFTWSVQEEMSAENGIKRVLKCLQKRNPLSVRLCAGWLFNLITNVHLPEKLTNELLWELGGRDPGCDSGLKLFLPLSDFLLELASKETTVNIGPFRSLVGQFFKTHFSEPSSLLKLLGVMWSCHGNIQAETLGLNLKLQLRGLQVGLIQLQRMDKDRLTELVRSTGPVLLPLMASLSSPVSAVREMAVHCLSVVHQRSGQFPFSPVVRRLVRCQEEITADQSYISQALRMGFGKALDSESSGKSHVKTGSKEASIKLALSDLIKTLADERTPLHLTKNMLQSLHLVNSEEVLLELLPLLKKLLSIPPEQLTDNQMIVTQLLLRRFTPETAHTLIKGSDLLSLFLTALKSPQSQTDGMVSIQETALNQISKAFYDLIGDSWSKGQILTRLFDILCSPASVSVAASVRRVIKHISIEAEHVSSELCVVLKALGADSFKEAKKLKRSIAGPGKQEQTPLPELENLQWERISFILESIQDKKKIHNSGILVPVCFKLIARILELEDDGSGEYLKQLLLTCIHTITSRLMSETGGGGEMEEVEVKVELIVQCIRSSASPQTHHQALTLLTLAAKLQPEDLLHNVMSVFTFMGANILRQDDSYSYHVIGKILETVIPSLVTACEIQSTSQKKSCDPEVIITMVIHVFVDSYPHIPSHRRLMLFTRLAAIVGVEKYLWRMLLILTNFFIVKATGKSTEDTGGESKASNQISAADLEFYLSLATSLPPDKQIMAAKDALVYLSTLPEQKPDSKGRSSKMKPKATYEMSRQYDSEIFSVDSHTAKQLRHFKYAVVTLLVNLLESERFIGQAASWDESEMKPHYEELLRTIMEYVTQLACSAETNGDNPTSRFWRALQHKVYDLLDKTVMLLPDLTFYEVTSGLMSHPQLAVQRRAMDLLNNKLQAQKDVTQEAEIAVLLPVVDMFADVVRKTSLASDIAEEKAVNGQTALFGLKLLSRHLANKHPKPFLQVLKLATGVFETRADNPQVCACGLLCVAEVCNSLKVHVIQHLSSLLPKLIQLLDTDAGVIGKELLLLSAITALQKVVENLTHFLSPYLLDIIPQVCRLSAQFDQSPKLQKPQLQFRLTTIRHTLATGLPTRVLLPALVSSYTKMDSSQQESVVPLMSLMCEHLKVTDKDQLNSHHNQLMDFFYLGLDFRVYHTQVPIETVSTIEGSVIDAIITMVMKLSEATFRPMIFKLCDWATRHEENKDRVLVFYRLADSLAEKLRGLFTLFAGHITKHTARMLDENNNAKEGELFFGKKLGGEKASQLLQYLLGYLHKCFLYDNEGFVNKERFQTLMQPLTDQIENTIGGESVFEERVSRQVVPCLTQFAVAAQDDAAWRSLNYQILLKTRSSHPKVRFAALLVLDELHKKLGEDYMSLLPETIPFLAELMEDDSEEVEKKCQSVIAEMEKTLGEPLQKYF